jgi:hypothetical protein
MSLLTDIRHVSDSAIDQLAGQFHDLPRPLLAAIGAGDMAVERLAKLREQLTDNIGTPSGDDVKSLAADLPARAQKIAGEVAHNLEQFAASAPEKAQKLIGELPAKASELTDSLSPANIRGTVEAYTQLVAMVYDNLAERGSKATDKVRAQAGKAADVVEAPATPKPAKAGNTTAAKTAKAATRTTKSATAKAGARTASTAKTAKTATRKATGTTTRRSTARKPAARGTKG